jgi:mono/diheme cytochrome c family protein
MKRAQIVIFVICFLLSATLLVAAAGDGLWVAKVPEKERARHNPFDGNQSAQAAGAKLFSQNCASCHGNDASGRDRHPSLRTDRIRSTTPGELQWLLTNGSMKNGMPSWSRLPEQQRWQIVSYIKTLPAAEPQMSAKSGR